MFLQNQIPELPKHFQIIEKLFQESEEARLVVAYVRQNGVDSLRKFFENKNIKLLCSFDMGITDPNAIECLLDLGVEVKVYTASEGTFHSKIWLFKKNEKWECIIGSANLTRAALFDNVEASVHIDTRNNFNGVIEQSLMFFNYLWQSEFTKNIDKNDIAAWKNKIETRKVLRNEIAKTENENLEKKTEILFEFVKNWIDISKFEKEDGVIGTLWRGWYIIPDQGYITDDKMTLLQNICKEIQNHGGVISLAEDDANFLKILNSISKKFVRTNHVLSDRSLFIRQEKNFLIKFGFASHPIKRNGKQDKQILILTSLGHEVAKCLNIICVKNLYTNFLLDYTYNGLKILKFTINLLSTLKYLTLDEFNLFVIHAYVEDELSEIINLIRSYRLLSDKEKFIFVKKCNSYFKEVKERPRANVLGNYIKKVKHTMSALGWANGIKCDHLNWRLELDTK